MSSSYEWFNSYVCLFDLSVKKKKRLASPQPGRASRTKEFVSARNPEGPIHDSKDEGSRRQVDGAQETHPPIPGSTPRSQHDGAPEFEDANRVRSQGVEGYTPKRTHELVLWQAHHTELTHRGTDHEASDAKVRESVPAFRAGNVWYGRASITREGITNAYNAPRRNKARKREKYPADRQYGELHCPKSVTKLDHNGDHEEAADRV